MTSNWKGPNQRTSGERTSVMAHHYAAARKEGLEEATTLPACAAGPAEGADHRLSDCGFSRGSGALDLHSVVFEFVEFRRGAAVGLNWDPALLAKR